MGRSKAPALDRLVRREMRTGYKVDCDDVCCWYDRSMMRDLIRRFAAECIRVVLASPHSVMDHPGIMEAMDRIMREFGIEEEGRG